MLIHIGKPLAPATLDRDTPSWIAARPVWIDRALHKALAQPESGWLALDASRAITHVPRKYELDGREIVAFRDSDGIVAAPAACPHMGADLSCGRVERGAIVCPWHGLALSRRGHGAWKPFRTHDDGVIAWVRFDGKAAPLPVLPERPTRFLDAVIRMEATCEPRDVLANRLDPWHGAHFHPHSFATLAVLEQGDADITVRVSYRAFGPFVVEVDARFHCPTNRSIVMTIVGGDGTGSVVETHATPLGPGRTAVIEATLATSDRRGFTGALRAASLVRPFIERRAERLWIDDVAYAERLYALRTRGTRVLGNIRSLRTHPS